MIRGRILSLGVAISTMLLCGVGRAERPAQTNPTQQELLDEVRALRSEVKDLRSRLDAKEPTTRPAAQAPGASAALTAQEVLRDADRRTPLFDATSITTAYVPDKGALIQSDDGNFLLHPWAFAQFRYASSYREHAKNGGSEWENGFEIPRMKFVLDGNVYGPDLTYQFIWSTSDTTGNLFLQDAWARYHIPGTPFGVQGGQIRDPVDHEQIMFATRSLTPERSIVNNVLLNSDNIVKGVDFTYGFDADYPLRAEMAFTSGMRNSDTTFAGFPANPADWGAAARVEWKLMGRWGDYNQFTAMHDREPLLVIGGGADYTEAGDTDNLIHVVDIQFNTPDALTLYAAYLGRYTQRNAGPPGTLGSFTTGGPHPDTYDATLRVLAAYLLGGHFEPFAKYEYLNFDRRELAATAAHRYIQDIGIGFNYYFYGHRAKFSADVQWLPNGSPIANTGADLLTNRVNQVIFEGQFQLII